MTRKVARSKRTTSSAAQMVVKSSSWLSRSSTFGINEYTISDQALERREETHKLVKINASMNKN